MKRIFSLIFLFLFLSVNCFALRQVPMAYRPHKAYLIDQEPDSEYHQMALDCISLLTCDQVLPSPMFPAKVLVLIPFDDYRVILEAVHVLGMGCAHSVVACSFNKEIRSEFKFNCLCSKLINFKFFKKNPTDADVIERIVYRLWDDTETSEYIQVKADNVSRNFYEAAEVLDYSYNIRDGQRVIIMTKPLLQKRALESFKRYFRDVGIKADLFSYAAYIPRSTAKTLKQVRQEIIFDRYNSYKSGETNYYKVPDKCLQFLNSH